MADAGPLRDVPENGVVRDRGAARGRGDDHPRPVPVARRVTLYHAPSCVLCERALEVVRDVSSRPGVEIELQLVDISGDPALEQRYRELLPVVEIDGERAFTYFVDPDALAARLSI